MKKVVFTLAMVLTIGYTNAGLLSEKIQQESSPVLPLRLQEKLEGKIKQPSVQFTYTPVMDSQRTTLLVREALKSLGEFMDGDLRITEENKQAVTKALEVIYLFAALKSDLPFKKNLEELFDMALNEFDMQLIGMYLSNDAQDV